MLEAARESNKYAEKDRLIYFLDARLLHHYAGNYETSNAKLDLAEAVKILARKDPEAVRALIQEAWEAVRRLERR